MLENAKVSQEEFEQKAQAVLNRLSHHPQIPLDEFLLPEGHAILENYLQSLDAEKEQKMKKTSTAGARPKAPLWPARHAVWGNKSDSEWWQASPFREESVAMRHPGLKALCPRQLDMPERLNLNLPEDEPSTVDVNMSLGRSRELIKNASACLTEKSLVYLAHRARLAHGVEHMMLMGFLVDEIMGPQGADVVRALMGFSSTFLKNMAGNAFDSSEYMVAMAVMSVILGELHVTTTTPRKKNEATEGKRKKGCTFNLMGTGYSDSDESDDGDTEDDRTGVALAASPTSKMAAASRFAPY